MSKRVLSLFSGIGLLDLGLAWAGMRTVGLCEIEPYCRWVLEQHWPGVPCWSDVREVTGDAVRERCGAVDLVAGGFPCQPHSVAGSRKGREDERHLWPEFARIVREVRPTWVLAENVPGLRTTAADEVLSDLDAAGYSAWPLVVGADDVGAPHRRKRVWIVAHQQGERREGTPEWPVGEPTGSGLETGRGVPERSREEVTEHSCPSDPTLLRGWPARPGEQQREWEAPRLADTSSNRRDCGTRPESQREAEAGHRIGSASDRSRQPEPGMGVSVDGRARWLARQRAIVSLCGTPKIIEALLTKKVSRSAARRARLRALGNGVVPQVVAEVGRAILAAEASLA